MNIQLILIFIINLSIALGKDVVIQKNENKELRLIGAETAEVGQFPWIVSLQVKKNGTDILKHFCAGSIVDNNHIVTAAHCVWNKRNRTILAIAGALNIKLAEDGQQRFNVSEMFVHPQYKSENRAGAYDLAVLRLNGSLKFDDRIGPISLPEEFEEASGECIHAGWGNRFLISGIYYNPSDVLRMIRSTVISKFRCLASYLFVLRRQLDTSLCTAAGPLRGSCQGDSGGPVTCYREDQTPYLAGVISWGWLICGDGFHPDVSTNVAQLLPYINGVLRNSTIVKIS